MSAFKSFGLSLGNYGIAALGLALTAEAGCNLKPTLFVGIFLAAAAVCFSMFVVSQGWQALRWWSPPWITFMIGFGWAVSLAVLVPMCYTSDSAGVVSAVNVVCAAAIYLIMFICTLEHCRCDCFNDCRCDCLDGCCDGCCEEGVATPTPPPVQPTPSYQRPMRPPHTAPMSSSSAYSAAAQPSPPCFVPMGAMPGSAEDVLTREQLMGMKMKKLKALMHRRGISLDGMVEKSELVDVVLALQASVQGAPSAGPSAAGASSSSRPPVARSNSTSARNPTTGQMECGICTEPMGAGAAKAQALPGPCGHAFCLDCLLHIARSGARNCPTCRAPFTERSIIKIYAG